MKKYIKPEAQAIRMEQETAILSLSTPVSDTPLAPEEDYDE